MKLEWFVFAILLALSTTLIVAFVSPQLPYEDVVQADGATQRVAKSHGFAHDRFATMRQGGPGDERSGRALWMGWVFVTLQVLFFGGCLALGMSRGGRLGPARGPIIGGTLVLVAIFAALFLSYIRFMNGETQLRFLGWPRPTAWVLFVVWTFPIFFMVLYYRVFDRWFFTADDEKRLAEITAEIEAARSQGGEA